MKPLRFTTAGWARFFTAVTVMLTAVSFSLAQTSPPQPSRVAIHAGRLLEVKSGRWLCVSRVLDLPARA